MVTVPILVMLDFAKEFILEIDASGLRVRVVLIQEGRPIAFLSKALSIQNRGKSVYNRESMAIVLAF